MITLSNIKKILDDYTVEYKKIYGRFAAEDMPIKHLRKDYELMSKYFTQDEILDWDKHQLSSIFEIICTITIDPAYTPLYETLGKFQKLLGLCTDGSAHNYELDVIWDTPADTPDNWKMLYDRRGHLQSIAAGLYAFGVFCENSNATDLLNDFHFTTICDSNELAVAVAGGLIALAKGRCLVPANIEFITQHKPYADAIGGIIATLYVRQIPTQDLLPLIGQHAAHAKNILFFLNRLSGAACHLESLRFIYEYPHIFGHQAVYNLSGNLRHSITVEQFQELSTAIFHADGDMDVALGHTQHLVHRWLGLVPAVRQQRGQNEGGGVSERPWGRINYAESAQNGAVESSVDASLRRLKVMYPLALREHLNANLAVMGKCIGALDSRERNVVAKAAFERFKRAERTSHYAREGVNFPQLLSLIWAAMHDTAKLIKPCTLDGAKARLITALCEAQKESLHDDAQDHGGVNYAACARGAFTKLVDALHTIHPAVEISFVNYEVAGFRVQALTKEMVKKHLECVKKSQPDTLQSVLDGLKENGVISLFKHIRSQIADVIFTEFQSLFENRENVTFREIVDTALDVDIDAVLKSFDIPTKQQTRAPSLARNPMGLMGASAAGVAGVQSGAAATAVLVPSR